MKATACSLLVVASLGAVGCSDSDSKRAVTNSDAAESGSETSSTTSTTTAATAIPPLTCASVSSALIASAPDLGEADINTDDQQCTLVTPSGTISLEHSRATELDLALAGALDSKSATVTPETGIGVEAGYAIVGTVSAVAWKNRADDIIFYVLVAVPASESEGLTEGELVDLAVAADSAI